MFLSLIPIKLKREMIYGDDFVPYTNGENIFEPFLKG